MILGQLVRKWRTAHELSRRSCAQMIGINHCTLARFEDGAQISGEVLATVLAWVLGNQPFNQHALATRTLDGPTYWCVDCVACHHCKLHDDLATAKRLLKACVTRGDVTQKLDARDEAIRLLSRDRWATKEALDGPQEDAK